jgi:hypothetical protein
MGRGDLVKSLRLWLHFGGVTSFVRMDILSTKRILDDR